MVCNNQYIFFLSLGIKLLTDLSFQKIPSEVENNLFDFRTWSQSWS